MSKAEWRSGGAGWLSVLAPLRVRLTRLSPIIHRYNLAAHIDPQNAGVLIVSLRGGGGARGMPETGDTGFTRDLAKHATGDEENCSIM